MRFPGGSRPSPLPLLVLCCVLPSIWGGCSDGPPPGGGYVSRLTLSGASLILVGDDGTGKTMITLERAEDWRFFGFAGSEALFLAFDNPKGGEATTFLYLYDLESGHNHILCEIGAAGEAAFAVSHDGTMVAFHWADGIYIFPLTGVLDQVRRGKPFDSCSRFEARLLRVGMGFGLCSGPAWLGPTTLTYGYFHGEECVESVLELSDEQRATLARLALR